MVAVLIVWRAELLCIEPEYELASIGFYEVEERRRHMNENVIDADRTKTAARTAIKKLYQSQCIVPSAHQKDFRCSHLDDCSDSRSELCTGNWPYIGAHYGEARVSGRRLRILFIAMERGGKSSYEFLARLSVAFVHTPRA